MKMYKGTTVFVKDGNFEKAMRKWKKKVQKKGTVQEVRDRQEFIKPSARKKLQRERAIRQQQLRVASERNILNTKQK